jgi:hypothetical protein
MFDPGEIALIEAGAGEVYKWKMVQPLTWSGTLGGSATTITVPASEAQPFVTDLASVPRTMTWLFPRYGAYTKAAVVHDHLCQSFSNPDRAGVVASGTGSTPVRDRSDADVVFWTLMGELGVPWMRRLLMWGAVSWATLFTALFPGRSSKPVARWVGRAVLVLGAIAAIQLHPFAGWAGLGVVVPGVALAVAVGGSIGMGRVDRLGHYLGAWALTIGFSGLLAFGLVLGVILAAYLLVEDASRGFVSIRRFLKPLHDRDERARLAFSPQFARLVAVQQS